MNSGEKESIFKIWCKYAEKKQHRKLLRHYTENIQHKDAIIKKLSEVMLDHYDKMIQIAKDLEEVGHAGMAEILRERLPRSVKSRSGDIGEILAAILVEEDFEYQVPVRRLRFKDGREMAMRGDDFIGLRQEGNSLYLLKGEAKSYRKLTTTPIANARKVLDRDAGRCTPHSLLFVADRLLDSPDDTANKLGRTLRNEVAQKSLPPTQIAHFLFTLSQNYPEDSLKSDLDAADSNRNQYSANLTITDHPGFIGAVFDAALAYGKR